MEIICLLICYTCIDKCFGSHDRRQNIFEVRLENANCLCIVHNRHSRNIVIAYGENGHRAGPWKVRGLIPNVVGLFS